ncbi:MAG TPA: hypothetical protein VFY23_09860 [Candidatus Limnocylindrales bacterium]|nr:hypothetical protein [Candidatus Limnocylindrales bacterium]
MEEPAGHAPTWPVVVRSRWHDPGYTRGEMQTLVGILLGLTWAVAVGIVMSGRFDPVLLLFPGALGGWIAFVWARRRPGTIALELAPDRLHVTRDGVDPLDFTVARDAAGWVVVASATLGSSERVVLLLDEPGNELARFRGIIAPVEISVAPGAGGAPAAADDAGRDGAAGVAAWWAAHMPAGTTPPAPPPVLPIAALVGEWWPDPARRIGLRNNGGRIPWVEPALPEWPAARRSHRRKAAAITAVVMLVLIGLAVRAGTTPALVAVIPPAVGGMLAGARNLFRP